LASAGTSCRLSAPARRQESARSERSVPSRSVHVGSAPHGALQP
jgi:hypothetical protein